jgi:SpoVK/Ycf46/Vps4 family AAA+-type ATPase
VPISTPKFRDWEDLNYLTEFTKNQLITIFEVHFGVLSGKHGQKQTQSSEGNEYTSNNGHPKLIFIVGPESMGVLEIIEIIKEKISAGFYNAQLLEDSFINPGALEQGVQHARAQKEQNIIILLQDLGASPPGIQGSFENWDNIIRSVTNISQRVGSNTTILWHCTTSALSKVSPEAQRSLTKDARIVFVELPSGIEVREKWLKQLVQKESFKNFEKIEVAKLAPKCLNLGYLDIERAFHRAIDEATSKNSCVTTQVLSKAINSLPKTDYDEFVESFIGLGYPPPPPPPPTHAWDEIVGLDAVKITFHYMKNRIDQQKGGEYNTLLLWGTPGCGKTLFARIAADISGYKLVLKTGTQLIGAYLGHTERAVHSFFDYIESTSKKMPVFAFIDEADPLSVSRDAKFGETTKYEEAAVEALIGRLGGFKELRNVIFMMSVNYPDSMDDAVARRFTYRIFVDPPNKKGYTQLWRLGLSRAAKEGNIVKLSDEDYEKLTELTYGKVLPSHIDGPGSIIEAVTANFEGRKIDLKYILEVMQGRNFYTDTMTIERYRKRKAELPDNFPLKNLEGLNRYIEKYGKELAITATAKEIVTGDGDETLYPLFSDVVGMDYEKLNLILICEDMLSRLEASSRAEKVTIEPVVVALWGPYGTGKTHLVKAVCNEMNRLHREKELSSQENGKSTVHRTFTFHTLNGGEEMTVEDVKKFLSKVSSSPPSILFIDEAERMLPACELSPTKRDIVSTFLNMIQGYEARLQGVMIVLSTNKPQEIDRGIWSRTSMSLYMPLPKSQHIPEIWQKNLEHEAPNLDTRKVNYDELAAKTTGVSPRKIQQVCKKATAFCRQMGEDEILTTDIIPILEMQSRETILEWDEEFEKSHVDAWVDRKAAIKILEARKDLAEIIKAKEIDTKPPSATCTLTIRASSNGTVSPSAGAHTHRYGDSITLKADPNSGYKFAYWEINGDPSTSNPITIPILNDMVVVPVITSLADVVVPPKPPSRYETFEVQKTSEYSEVSTEWLRVQLGRSNLPKSFHAKLFIQKAIGLEKKFGKVEFVHNEMLDKGTIRLSSNILTRAGIPAGASYQIKIEILNRDELR